MRSHTLTLGKTEFTYVSLYIDYTNQKRKIHISNLFKDLNSDENLFSDSIIQKGLRPHYGIIHSDGKSNIKLEKEYIAQLVKKIMLSDLETVYVLDFSSLPLLAHDSYIELIKLNNYPVVFHNIQNLMFSGATGTIESEFWIGDNAIPDIRRTFINAFNEIKYDTGEILLFSSKVRQFEDFYNFVEELPFIPEILTYKILDKCFTDVKDNIKHLKSSNVYANKYFDAKKLFQNPEYREFIIYKLASLVVKSNEFNKEIEMLSTNYNSICIQSIIAEMINHKGSSICSLGPEFSIEEYNALNGVVNNKNFVEIFDFICLGNEYRFGSALMQISLSNIKGGFGLAMYRDPYRDRSNGNRDIISLIDFECLNGLVTKHTKNVCNYSISIDRLGG